MSLAVTLDGVDVSGVALRGSVTRKLNRPSTATITIPMDAAIGGPGSRLKITIDGSLRFHGFVLLCETDTGEDIGYTVYNATDPMEMWQWRPARDGPGGGDPGDFSKPDFFERVMFGPQIMEEILTQSQNWASSADDDDAEGPLFLSLDGFATGGRDLSGAPVDWPMTIAEIASLLVSTGRVDIIINPIDSGGNMGSLNVYNGDYGTDLTGSVVFQYGTGTLNVRRMRWNEDMSNMCNKLWYYLGPKWDDQHWQASVTGSADGVHINPLNHPPYAADQAAILTKRNASRGTYGVRMDIKIFDALGDEGPGEAGALPLFLDLWQKEQWIRAAPRDLIHITPNRGFGINTFDIGDLITVQAGAQVRGGFSGAQRVYEYTCSWDEDGPFELSELQSSESAEGI